jgi:hypothetical protein
LELVVDVGLAWASEGDDRDLGMHLGEPSAELDPAVRRPAAEGQVLGATGTDVDAEPRGCGDSLFLFPEGCPLPLGVREGDFESGFAQLALEAEQREQSQVVLGSGDGVVLRDRVGDEPAIERGLVLVLMGESSLGVDDPGDDPVLASALGMEGEGQVVALGAETEEEGEGTVAGALDQVELMDGVDPWVAFEELGAAGPKDGDVDASRRKLESEFVEDRGGLKGVPDTGEADDKDPFWMEWTGHGQRRLQ